MKIEMDLTPRQFSVLNALVREEVMLDRLGEKRRAAKLMEKLEACDPVTKKEKRHAKG